MGSEKTVKLCSVPSAAVPGGMEKPWEKQGENHGKTWKNHGKTWEFGMGLGMFVELPILGE
jgi:hypothetical protein